MPKQLKIVVAGPKASGKTTISNYLSGFSTTLTCDKYEPTYGVRILETDAAEIWDSAGDQTFEGCWKATMADADGVILVYNPDAPAQDSQMADWFDFFVKKNGLKDEQCMIFAHRIKANTEKFRPPPLFSRVTAAVITSDSTQDVRTMFDNFIKDIQGIKQRK